MDTLVFDTMAQSSSDDFDLLFAQLDSGFDPTVFDLGLDIDNSDLSSSTSNSPTNTESSVSDYSCINTQEVFQLDSQQLCVVNKEPESLNLDLTAFNEFIEKNKSSLVTPVSICVPAMQDKNGVKVTSEIILNFEPSVNNTASQDHESVLLSMLNSGEFDDVKPVLVTETRIDLEAEEEDDGMEDESSQDSLVLTDAKKILTEEEKSVYQKEGYKIPNRLPLTKSEEKLLKLVKRKIRNKKSAHVSRERKKKYVDGLEKRVDLCTKENEELHKTVQLLKTQNSQLMSKMQSMQSCLALLLNKHKKSSTAVLFVSFLITFCIYPYVDESSGIETALSNSGSFAPLNYRNSISRALFSLNFSGGDGSSQTQQDVVWNYYKARFDI